MDKLLIFFAILARADSLLINTIDPSKKFDCLLHYLLTIILFINKRYGKQIITLKKQLQAGFFVQTTLNIKACHGWTLIRACCNHVGQMNLAKNIATPLQLACTIHSIKMKVSNTSAAETSREVSRFVYTLQGYNISSLNLLFYLTIFRINRIKAHKNAKYY